MDNLGIYEIETGAYKDIETATGETLTAGNTYYIQIVSSGYGIVKYCQKSSAPDEAEGFNLSGGKDIIKFVADNTNVFYIKALTEGVTINIAEEQAGE